VTQLKHSRDQAREAVDAFLADQDGAPFARPVTGDDGLPAAWIVSARHMEELEDGHRKWLASQEIQDSPDLPPGYRPWVYSPLATTERLLPTEPMQEPLAHFMFGEKYADLDQAQRDRVTYSAISLLLRVTLDPDGIGVVPVLAMPTDHDNPGPGLRWQLAYVTSVPGLYLRQNGNWLSGEWGIVTGSGYRMPCQWHDRDDANSAVEALGRVLPNCDWMRLTPGALTPEAMAAVTATLRKYASWGLNDKAPEPEVMPVPVPAEEASQMDGMT
jgi:hypothetical protein